VTVFVVTGPPAAGKSTWVRDHAKPGDITIDYDTLAQALSPGLPSDPAEQPSHIAAVIMASRAAAFDDAVLDAATQCDVYLVHAMPARQHMNRYRKYGFEVVTIDPGYDECMRRAAADRTPRQREQVREWYERRGLLV